MAPTRVDKYRVWSMGLLLAIIGTATCLGAGQHTSDKGGETKSYTGKGRDVLFEGPWDFLKDTRDPKNPRLVAVAAVAPNHDKAQVVGRPNQKLDTGVYALSLPGAG